MGWCYINKPVVDSTAWRLQVQIKANSYNVLRYHSNSFRFIVIVANGLQNRFVYKRTKNILALAAFKEARKHLPKEKSIT